MKSELVVKSNKLVNQSYKLSANEQKILYLLITKIHREDEDFKRYALKISEFVALSGLSGSDKHSTEKGLPKITRDLLKKGFSVVDEKNNLLQVNWLSSAYHRKNEGIIELEFSPRLKPYLLQLKEKFTMFSLENVIKLKSAYSMRIYELLKQYESYGDRTFTLDELKYTLGINLLKAYDRYNNFKSKILEIAKVELQEQCDLYFEYAEIKEGKKVNKIKFIICRKGKINKILSLSSNIKTDKPSKPIKKPINKNISIDTINFIQQFQDKYNAILDDNVIQKLIDSKGYQTMQQLFTEYHIHTKSRSIGNIAGDFITFTKGGYQIPVSVSCNSIHNFDEREYEDSVYDNPEIYANTRSR